MNISAKDNQLLQQLSPILKYIIYKSIKSSDLAYQPHLTRILRDPILFAAIIDDVDDLFQVSHNFSFDLLITIGDLGFDIKHMDNMIKYMKTYLFDPEEFDSRESIDYIKYPVENADLLRAYIQEFDCAQYVNEEPQFEFKFDRKGKTCTMKVDKDLAFDILVPHFLAYKDNDENKNI